MLCVIAISGPPAFSRTIDLEGLSAPRAGDRGDALELPRASEALGTAGKRQFGRALQSFMSRDFARTEELSRGLTVSAAEAPEGWYMLGMALANLDRRQEAIEALDRAAGLYRRNAAPLVIKGDLLLSLDRPDDAGRAWQAATEADPTNWHAHERLAALSESRGDRDDALAHYDRAIAETSDDHLYPRLQAARLNLLAGRPDRTEALLDDMAAAEDAPSVALDYLARAKVGLDRPEEGRALFDRLMERAESPRPFLARARLAVADRDLPAAVAVLERARTHFPEDPALMLEQGRILGAAGRYDDALAVLDKGLAQLPAHPALLRAASLAATRTGDMDAALTHARSAAELPGATSDDRIRLASLLERMDGGSEAQAIYADLLESEPDNWLALNNLANLLTDTEPDRAVALAERAVALAPDIPTLRDTLGLAQSRAGQADQAASTFEALRADQPGAALPVYRLGVLRIEQGQPEEGRSLLQEALSLEPEFTYAGDARQRLR